MENRLHCAHTNAMPQLELNSHKSELKTSIGASEFDLCLGNKTTKQSIRNHSIVQYCTLLSLCQTVRINTTSHNYTICMSRRNMNPTNTPAAATLLNHQDIGQYKHYGLKGICK